MQEKNTTNPQPLTIESIYSMIGEITLGMDSTGIAAFIRLLTNIGDLPCNPEDSYEGIRQRDAIWHAARFAFLRHPSCHAAMREVMSDEWANIIDG